MIYLIAMEMNSKEIGKKLVMLRGSRSQEDVSSSIGISTSALSMYERGERIPRDSIKIRISEFYNEPIQDIFYPKITRNVSE